MSKYEPLWKWIQENGTERFQLTFAQIEEIAGLPIDHSFLKCIYSVASVLHENFVRYLAGLGLKTENSPSDCSTRLGRLNRYPEIQKGTDRVWILRWQDFYEG